MMELFLCVRSTDSILYYPKNNPGHFRVKLPRPLILEGSWTVGLCEIHTSTPMEVLPGLYSLHCKSCTGMLTHDLTSDVLRMVQPKRNVHVIYTCIYYMPIETHFIESLEIYFKDSKGALVSLAEEGVLECVLHFKRQNG